MTKTNSFSAKLFVGFVATAMLFTLSYTPARAATADELQAQITALMAQIAALQGGSTSSGSCHTFTMDLTMGASGAEVTALQTFLMAHGQTIAAGATGYFGGQTQAALASFQAANGIAPAAGYFGPISRAKVNAMCTPSGDDSDDSSDDDSSDDDSSSDDLSGEASLDTTNLKDGDDTDAEEGQEDVPVADLELEFTDGDAKITRLDISLVDTGTEEDPWDTFDEVSLWVDGEEVARQSASDEDDYLDEDDGSIRFSGLDIVANEDEELTITIGVSVQGSVDDMPATWNVDATALRFIDGDDVSSTETISETAVDFDIAEAGDEDEVIVRTSTTDPDATTIAVDENDKSDFTTVFAFDLDTDDSVNDIEVNEIPVSLFTGNLDTNQVISDVMLVIDGEEFDEFTWDTDTTATGTATFDIDGDLVIEAGDRVTVEVQVEFLKQSGNYSNGQTIHASTTGAYGDFEGVDDVIGEGNATGEEHTLRTEGAVLEFVSSTETIKANTDTTTTDDEGVFTIKFDVTAFENDLYVNKTTSRGSTMGTVGVNFLIEDSNGALVSATGTASASISSTADTEGTQFKVNEGETETFTLTVNYDPGAAGFFQVQLYSINFATIAGNNPSDQQVATPESDYETDQLSI